MPEPSALICFSSFKGTLSNVEACDAIAPVFKELGWKYDLLPIGDGGRGTLHAVQACLGGELAQFEVSRPIVGKTQATVLCIPDARSPFALYIEAPEAIGHHLVEPEKRDAMRATSVGLGELLKQASERWKSSTKQLYIGLGDSAVSDAGMGMLTALGHRFFDMSGHELWGNADSLRQIRSIRPIQERERVFPGADIYVLCDVLNPLCGPMGTARVFAPQKGASQGQVSLIEMGVENFADQIEQQFDLNLKQEPLTGSAGGLGAAFKAFLRARLVHGAHFLLDWIQFDEKIRSYDFLITGEGKTDQQTLSGKAPFECIRRAQTAEKKILVVSGQLGSGFEPLQTQTGVVGIYDCGAKPNPKQALHNKVKEIITQSQFKEKMASA